MSANIGVSLSATKLELAPGESAETTIIIRNQGQIVDDFILRVEGLDPTWWTLSVPSVSLFPGDEDMAKLTLHPPKEGGVRAGSHTFQIKAASRANPQEVTSEDVFLILRGFAAWEVAMAPTKVVGRSGTYRLTVNNSGNTDVNLVFEGKDPEEGLRYEFSQDQLTVPAGETARVRLKVRPEKGESKKQYSFQVLIRPAGTAAGSGETKTLNGQLEYRRRKFPWWVLLLIVGLVVVGFVAWLLLSGRSISCSCPAGCTAPGPPAVALTAPREGPTWAAGSTITIKWEATGSGTDYMTLSYSLDDGASWVQFHETTVKDGTYEWQVPPGISGDCDIGAAIWNADQDFLTGDSRGISIQGAGPSPGGAEPTFTLTAPQDGDTLVAGSPYQIRWEAYGADVHHVALGYSADEGATWEKFADDLPTVGTYNWPVPSTLSGQILIGASAENAAGDDLALDYKHVLIQGAGAPITPTLSIIKPVDDEFWDAGSTHEIRWKTTGSGIAHVSLGYSPDGGTTWVGIVYNLLPTVGTFQWPVPATFSGEYLIGGAIYDSAGEVLAYRDRAIPIFIQPGATTPTTPTLPVTVTLHYESSESGTVWSDDYVDPFLRVMAGDFADNTIARGYVSFDISWLVGSDVTSAKLTFNQADSYGDPFGESLLGLSEVGYPPRALIAEDYYLPTLNNLKPSNTGTGSIDVSQFVEWAVVNRQDRFQVRFRFPFDTNNDGLDDFIQLNPVTLEVTYR
ncbi:MAG: hypothetical protein ISS52_00185 [Dehalococcoidia bacterium]|nr:hypothetical protein [Dehalococcoidia bacterium]